MATDVVKAIQVTLSITSDDKLVTCRVELEPVTSLWKSVLVRDEEPFLGEDGASFKLKHLWGGVPC